MGPKKLGKKMWGPENLGPKNSTLQTSIGDFQEILTKTIIGTILRVFENFKQITV